MSYGILSLKKVKVEIPAFVYTPGLDKCTSEMLRIEGKFTRIFKATKFKGYIEFVGERYYIKYFCDNSEADESSIMVFAGVIQKPGNSKKGLTAYVDKDFKIVKGTLYLLNGENSMTMDFAAPANSIIEAEKIENILEPECFKNAILQSCCHK